MRILILHGWESNSTEHWFLKAKQKLEELGHQVVVPDMPNTLHPKKEEWIKVIEDFAPDETSILVGHSLGGTTILGYLENTDRKINRCVLIAAPMKKLGVGFEPIENFFEPDFDWGKIKENCKNFIILNQTKDTWVPLQHGKDLARYTNGSLNIIEGDNHFDTIDFPLLSKAILD